MDQAKTGRKQTKADKFWSMFLFTENGKVKSTLLIYSFSLSILFVMIYLLSYLMLIDPIDAFFLPRVGTKFATFLESVLPAIAGTALCCPIHFAIKEKKLAPAAYLWLLFYSLATGIGLIASLTKLELPTFLGLFSMVALPPLAIGGAASALLYMKYRKKLLNR